MSLFVPLGLLLCSALWLKGLRSIWARALLLASFLGLTFVLLPSVGMDTSSVHLAIYQVEASAFAADVAADIDRGDSGAAKKQLLYFSKHQDRSTANDPEALRAFFREVRSAGKEMTASNSQAVQSPAPR